MKIQMMLFPVLAFSLTACGGTRKKTMNSDRAKECKILYHDVDAGKAGETEYLPRDVAVARIKMIKALPGFPKLKTDQWLSCR